MGAVNLAILISAVAGLVWLSDALDKSSWREVPPIVDTVNSVFDPLLSLIDNQRKSNENGTRSEFENFLWTDESNEGLENVDPQYLIKRAGFKYKNHYVLADDGYITSLIRIINPLADRRSLKQPPIMLANGGIIDQTSWIWASNIQTFPEKYPRNIDEDGPIRSANRSLAFTLANNGYDVWLVGRRGTNRQNQGFVNPEKFGLSLVRAKSLQPNKRFDDLTPNELDYWRYSMDEITQFDLPRQIDKVLTITGAEKVALVPSTLGTMTALSLLASNQRYADKVHVHVQILPFINNRNANNLVKFLLGPVAKLPEDLGIRFITFGLSGPVTRSSLKSLNMNRLLRYTVVWGTTTALVGPSPTFQTNLESAVIGHVFQPISFVELKHLSQQVHARKLKHFDYGPIRNKLVYDSFRSPAYDISKLAPKSWMIVAAANDKIAPLDSALQLLAEARPTPDEHIIVPGYNHLDVLAAQDNDVKVNLPVMSFLDRHSLPPLERRPTKEMIAESLKMDTELELYLPQKFND